MALKAGYIGIKKSMLGLINSLASAKLIKSFGDGLTLTNAGKLNMTAATASKIGGVKVGEGLSIDNGVLSVTATGSVDYSTTEVDTGIKWVDGKKIYAKSYDVDSSIPSTGTAFDTIANIDKIVSYKGSATIGTNKMPIIFNASSSSCFPYVSNTGAVALSYAGSLAAFTLTIYYTKSEEV